MTPGTWWICHLVLVLVAGQSLNFLYNELFANTKATFSRSLRYVFGGSLWNLIDDVTVVSYHELSVYSLAVLDHLIGEMMKENRHPVHCRRMCRVIEGHTQGRQESQ